MPSVTHSITPTGAELAVSIRPGEAMVRYLRDNGNAVPAPLGVVGLIDTAANLSAVKRGVLKDLLPCDSVAITMVSGQTIPGDCFEIELAVIDLKNKAAPLSWIPLLVAEVDRPGGPLCQIVLGRDFLAHFALAYNDPKGKFTLRW